MTATSYDRGWPIVYRNDKWVYQDNGEPSDENRPCVRCGRPPTADGYDACLSHIEGVMSACCGHGVEAGYVVKQKD